METLAKYHVCNHCVIGEKTFRNILIGPGNTPEHARNGHEIHEIHLNTKGKLRNTTNKCHGGFDHLSYKGIIEACQ